MKKIFRALTLCLVLLSLLCAAVPAAFAAGNKEDAFYTIGLDACGGVSSTVVVTTNLDGKLTTLPESPTMDGYTFNGWYTEPDRKVQLRQSHDSYPAHDRRSCPAEASGHPAGGRHSGHAGGRGRRLIFTFWKNMH